jgi:hypothetical protein
VAVVVSLPVADPAAPAGATGGTSPSVSVAMSGIWGGGFINAIARDPVPGSRRMLIGGDSSGFDRSSDSGQSWAASNAGLDESAEDTIAALAYRTPPADKQVLAAFGGGSADTSGILKSANGGASWTEVAQIGGGPVPVFRGHSPGGEAAYQVGSAPRATGHLLALDETGGSLRHLYAGTFGLGVMRSDDGGASWTPIALGVDATNPHCTFQTNMGSEHGCFVTSVVRSPIPGEVDTLYVSVHGGDPSFCIGDGLCGGVFRVANAACSGTGCADITTTLVDAVVGPDPVNAEELTFSGRTLLCACGTDGFYKRSTSDPGLIQRNTNLAFDPEIVTSYPAIAAGKGLIVLGAYNPACETVDRLSCHTVYESTDQGLTWTDLTFGIPIENIDLTVAGTTVEWWEGSKRASMIDGASYNVSSIVLTDDPAPTVLVAGHSGVWTSEADHLHWQPAVQGIGATTTNDVVADPNNAGRVYVGVTDWVAFASDSNLDPGTVVQTEPPPTVPKKSVGFALAVDAQDTVDPPSDVYMGAGKSGPNYTDIGESYLDPDPVTDPWQPEAFVTDGSCDRTTPRIIGVAVGHATDLAPPVVFAATDGCGLYRFGDGTWIRVGTTTGLFTTEDFFFNYAPLSFPDSLGRVLYAMDRKSGELWRTADGGDHWSSGPIFTIPEAERAFDAGWMVADPNAVGESVVWVATEGAAGLHRLSCATLCQQSAWTDQSFPEVVNPGPVALAPCTAPCTSVVYVATRAVAGDPTHPPTLYKSTPDGGFCEVTAGSRAYRSAANFPVQLAVGPSVDGEVAAYLTTVGEGVLVVVDASSPTCGAV